MVRYKTRRKRQQYVAVLLVGTLTIIPAIIGMAIGDPDKLPPGVEDEEEYDLSYVFDSEEGK